MATGDKKPQARAGQRKGKPARKSGAKTPTISKGLEWEYRLARLRFYQGHFVRRSIDIWPRSLEGNKVGEYDLLSLSFDPQLRQRLELIEAKTTGGGAGEIGQVLWLRGAASLLHADDVAFAKLQIADRVREVGRELEVELVDEAAVQAAESAVGIAGQSWVGMHDPEFGERVVKPARERLTGNQDLNRIGKFLYGRFWVDPTFARLKRLRTACELLAQHWGGLDSDMLVLASGEVAVLFAVSAFGVTSLMGQYTPAEYSEFVSLQLSTGLGDEPGLRQLLRRIDSMNRVVINDLHDRYTASGVARVIRPIPQLESEILVPPEWVDAFLDLSHRLRVRTRLASDVLRALDLRTAYRLGSTRSSAKVERQWSSDAKAVKETADTIEAFLMGVWGAPAAGFRKPESGSLPVQISNRAAQPTVEVTRQGPPSAVEPMEPLPGLDDRDR